MITVTLILYFLFLASKFLVISCSCNLVPRSHDESETSAGSPHQITPPFQWDYLEPQEMNRPFYKVVKLRHLRGVNFLKKAETGIIVLNFN
ncbi:hypothetical protein TNCV_3198811 [Trichonephila clavipes]|nr:hypothetical protein TNCV_3198811 [Trichonephila clavipes]